jgi:hypothetical protein
MVCPSSKCAAVQPRLPLRGDVQVRSAKVVSESRRSHFTSGVRSIGPYPSRSLIAVDHFRPHLTGGCLPARSVAVSSGCPPPQSSESTEYSPRRSGSHGPRGPIRTPGSVTNRSVSAQCCDVATQCDQLQVRHARPLAPWTRFERRTVPVGRPTSCFSGSRDPRRGAARRGDVPQANLGKEGLTLHKP